VIDLNLDEYELAEFASSTYRVYPSTSDDLVAAVIRVAMKQELIRCSLLRGLHQIVKALIKLNAITFQTWVLHETNRIIAAYRIVVDGSSRHFATPEELLRKLDELGVFAVE